MGIWLASQPVSSVGVYEPLVVPSDYDNLYAWYDVSDSTTVFQDDAGATPVTANNQVIGRLADKSGNSRHMIQATADDKPLYKTRVTGNRPMALFDGVDDFLKVTFGANLSQPHSIVAVGRYVVLSTNHFIGGRDATTGTNSSGVLNVDATYFNMFSGTNLPNTDVARNTDWFVFWALFNGANSVIRVNGTQVIGSSGTRVIRELGLGANARDALYANCYIGEVAVFSDFITIDERVDLETELALKWGFVV